MHPLVIAKLKRTFKRLNDEGFPETTDGFAEMDQLSVARSYREFRLGSWSVDPIFFTKDSVIKSPQIDLLGFFGLVVAIRSAFRAVNFLVGAFACRDKGINGPVVALSYSAAYHTLTAYLVAEGRMIFDQVISPYERTCQHCIDGPVVAMLTKNSKWCLEPMKRVHKARWKHLWAIYNSDPGRLAPCFKGLFEHLYRGRFRSGVSPIEIMKNPSIHRLTLGDVSEEFFERIAEVRHFALYAGFGDDPHIAEALVNGDTCSSLGLNRQSEAVLEFSGDLLRHVAMQLGTFVKATVLKEELREKLFLSVYAPYFDQPKVEEVLDADTRKSLALLRDWVYPTKTTAARA